MCASIYNVTTETVAQQRQLRPEVVAILKQSRGQRCSARARVDAELTL